ncbi:hypothetical protein J2X01_000257 [Arthrobacter ginsengisoli]|uniref:Lipoprotein LpqB N-terminal domain-containing protein n=1 Tax=Arthrobacter ginsengisoli TaxID=1356565 RepID=A0ABU1U723_9MICC|nr:hypothetical protein [Arthrobacter ginsengisoli]MDR7080988.1 hypothetical protein [Arthrobacter ginsengisoli]
MIPESNEPGPNERQPAAAQPPAAPAPEPSAPPRPDRTLLGIIAAIAVLVIVALVVVFTRGEPAPLDEATPAGVVQRYSAAVIAGDEEAASAYLSDAAKTRCSDKPRMGARNLRVTLVSTTERPATADVAVLITVSENGGVFGSNEYQMEQNFDLVKTADKWLIDSAPWDLAVCPNPVVK